VNVTDIALADGQIYQALRRIVRMRHRHRPDEMSPPDVASLRSVDCDLTAVEPAIRGVLDERTRAAKEIRRMV
jgi:hypothetical protein